jgi:hypothetical protein
LTSHGPSGIGFVNFGEIDHLDVQAPIETFGTGARAFNLYDGSLRHASFENIATHGDGSVGVQVSGDNVITVEIDGNVGQIEIAKGVVAEGNDSDAIHTRGMVPGLTDVSIKTTKGQEIVLTS